MNQVNKGKKNYIQPKIEVIQVEMEGCIAAGPVSLNPISNSENKQFMEKLKIIK
ncbi:hypothetical protein SF1_03080 [Sphingobacterium faecium NBRC 15299]|uniref:hypothetical protein n=1 Tax=Sphingobacterium faecium TaxID=34087 RepID=UPI000D47EF3D|nr:hypothetical protein [Sphingobacterium faecium]PTX12620.1 hypothetical protein C8N37_102315 [Sphingobacterium faecium]GEM62326.1 hypothetical protein SF1_03080 [Sphingobacterium faecium NBRC 15299]